MTDRSQAKPFEQDLLGIVFCALGGFVAVSIVLAWMGQEPIGDLWSLPIQSLVAALGPFAALLFSVGLAVLGTMLFLRATSMASLRLLLGLSAAAIGLSLLAGILGQGGGLGHVFPELLPGGKVLAGVLGLAVLWLGLVLASPGSRKAGGSEVVQRVGLTTRSESREASVSAAEAALLTRESPPARTGSLGLVTPLPRGTGSPARPAGARPASEPTRRTDEPSVRPLTPAQPVRPLVTVATPIEEAGATSPAAAEAPPAPSWEQEESTDPFSGLATPLEESSRAIGEDVAEDVEEPEPDVAEDETLVAEVEESAELEEEDEASDDEEGDDEEEEGELVAEDDSAEVEEEEYEDEDEAELEEAAELDDPEDGTEEEELESEEGEALELEASDDEESVEAEEIEAESAADELPLATQALVDAAEPRTGEVPAEAPPVRASWEQIGLFDEDEETSAPAPRPARPARVPRKPAAAATKEPAGEEAGFTLEPAARAARGEEPVEAGERDWSRLVHEAGCLFLDENRVAVSMLQRRFSIEFDAACRVLDELQEAGLIGPYMGGRTRDILLTRDEWLAQAPRVS